jgi:enoyl-CoA hydratase/carnithine racemase
VTDAGSSNVVARREPDVVWLGLDRAAKRNALDEATVRDLHAALDEWATEPAVVVLHSTTPGIFASGADLRELVGRDAESALRRINIALFDRIERRRWPTIAVVDGPALGAGCELALACDFRIATPEARFGQPETSLGIIAGAGGNWRLASVVGLPVARRMLLVGDVLDGASARDAGLVDWLAERDELDDEVHRVTSTIAARSWRALELTKLALRQGNRPTDALDVVAQALLFEGEEKRERIEDLLARRSRR